MNNKLHKTTKSGKPMIKRFVVKSTSNNLPIHNSNVDYRIKQANIALGIHSDKNSSFEDKWNAIKNEIKLKQL